MTAPARFRQADVRRAIEAAQKTGLKVARYEIDRDGRIVVHCAGGAPANDDVNEWDEVLGAT